MKNWPRRALRLTRRLKNRSIERRRLTVVPAGRVGDLLFGQQHVGTQRWFADQHGTYHTVPVVKMPHYDFATATLSGTAPPRSYASYIEASWRYYVGPNRNTETARQEQLTRFVKHIEAARSAGRIDNPIRVYPRPDGRMVIIDGNHRAAIAAAFGWPLPAVVVPPEEALADVARVPGEFYGSQRLEMPYQSLFHDGQELVRGRRPDTLQRMQLLEGADLAEASVLELGCNIGGNSYLAVEHGARSALGVDVSPAIVSAAVRLNAYYARPCEFRVHDLNVPLDTGQQYDVVLCFSVVAHLASVTAIARTIEQLTGKVLYFEGHAESKRADYDYVLDAGLFSRVDLVAYCQAGIDDRRLNRPLFRCEV